MAARRIRPRTLRRTPAAPVLGQTGLFGSDQPWQPTSCDCWPPDPRACQHCRRCDTCQDCGRCAGPGCACACSCEDDPETGADD